MSIDLENAFFYKVEDGKIIYRMSEISLDEYLKGCELSIEDEDYLYGEIALELTGHTLQSAVLTLYYKEGKCEEMDVAADIAPEIVDDALENSDYDWEAYSKTIKDFYKF